MIFVHKSDGWHLLEIDEVIISKFDLDAINKGSVQPRLGSCTLCEMT